MRSSEGDAVGFNTFYCTKCKEEHPVYIAVSHPHREFDREFLSGGWLGPDEVKKRKEESV
jgi:hypothetical protein